MCTHSPLLGSRQACSLLMALLSAMRALGYIPWAILVSAMLAKCSARCSIHALVSEASCFSAAAAACIAAWHLRSILRFTSARLFSRSCSPIPRRSSHSCLRASMVDRCSGPSSLSCIRSESSVVLTASACLPRSCKHCAWISSMCALSRGSFSIGPASFSSLVASSRLPLSRYTRAKFFFAIPKCSSVLTPCSTCLISSLCSPSKIENASDVLPIFSRMFPIR
mmetsp:Transcript_41100/g.84078  ORF Transcript_41100/g.84078 Transcript_41100/m.84078 type:complete len:224 (+) Transcript_41100:257-928(+)